MKRKRLWLILGVVVLLLLALYAAAGWFFSTFMIASPTQTLEAARAETGDPAAYGLPQPEEVAIDAGEITLTGWYFDNPADGDCGVMFMHGFTGTRYQVLYWAPLFWERGCDILTYDHRGHGASTPALHTYGYFEKQDALAALRWFEGRSGLDESQIGVAGVSYGAATALQLAPLIPDAPFALADSSYRTMPAIVGDRAEARFGRLGRSLVPAALIVAGLRGGFNPWAVSPEDGAAAAQIPILLVHSRTDGFTPYTHSEAIYAGSDPARTALHINEWGAPHGGDIGIDFAAYRRLFNDFLAQHAPGFGLPVAP